MNTDLNINCLVVADLSTRVSELATNLINLSAELSKLSDLKNSWIIVVLNPVLKLAALILVYLAYQQVIGGMVSIGNKIYDNGAKKNKDSNGNKVGGIINCGNQIHDNGVQNTYSNENNDDRKTQKLAEVFNLLFHNSMEFGTAAAIILVVFALAITGSITSEGAITVLGGIAGYVFGSAKQTYKEEVKPIPQSKEEEVKPISQSEETDTLSDNPTVS